MVHLYTGGSGILEKFLSGGKGSFQFSDTGIALGDGLGVLLGGGLSFGELLAEFINGGLESVTGIQSLFDGLKLHSLESCGTIFCENESRHGGYGHEEREFFFHGILRLSLILNSKDALLRMRSAGAITTEIEEVIGDPFKGYAPVTQVFAGEDLHLFRTRRYRWLRSHYKPGKRSFLEWLLKVRDHICRK